MEVTVQNTKKIVDLFNRLQEIETALRDAGVVRSRKVTADIGEWYGCVLLGLERAENPSQKGHDLVCPKTGRRFQVKTDRKKTGSQVTVWIPEEFATQPALPFDELLIVGLSQSYRIREFYRIPLAEITAAKFGRLKGGNLNLNTTNLMKHGYAVSGNALVSCPSGLAPLLFE